MASFFSMAANSRLFFRPALAHASTPVRASIAPHTYRFSFLPGVGTCFCFPRFIQSGPILGFRWTSTSSR